MPVLTSKYPPESAGRIRVKNVPTAFLEETISDVRKKIFEKAREYETLNYVYVLGKDRKLLGVFSIKDVLQKSGDSKVKELMMKEVVKVRPTPTGKEWLFWL